MSDNISLEETLQVVKSVGDAWVISKSKKSGRVYYFNTLTGEAVWNLSYADLQKAKKYRDSNEQALPEPPSDTHRVIAANNDQVTVVQKVNNTVSYTDSCGATMPDTHPPSVVRSLNNFFYSQQPNMAYPPATAYPPPHAMFPPQHISYPQSNAVFQTFNPSYPGSNPFYPPSYPSYHPMMNPSVSMDDQSVHVFHNTLKPLSSRFMSQKEENSQKEETVQSTPKRIDLVATKKCSTSKQFDLRQVLLAKKKSNSDSVLTTNQRNGNQVEDKEEDLINERMETLNVNLNPEPAQTEHINPWVDTWVAPGSFAINREEKQSASPVEQCSIEEVKDSWHTANNDDNTEDEDDEKWLSENMNSFGNKAVLDVSALKSLSGANGTGWYILPDTNVFYRNLTFLNILVNSDEECRLLVVPIVYNEIRVLAKKENSAPLILAARYACRFIDRLLRSERAVMSGDLLSYKVGVGYPVGDDEILDHCLGLVKQKQCVVLLSNDRLLLRKTRIAMLQTFTIKQLKNFLAYYQRRANIDNNKPILITLNNVPKNSTNELEENYNYEENDIDEQEHSNQLSFNALQDNSNSSESYEYPVNEPNTIEVSLYKPNRNSITYDRTSKSAVTFDKPAKSAVTFDKPAKSAVTFDKPAKSAVTFDKPAKSAVTFDKAAKSAVTFDKPAKSAVTFDKPAKSAVTFDKAAKSAVTFDKPAKSVVTFDKPAKSAVTFDKPAKSAVTFDKPAKSFVTFDKPAKSAVTFDKTAKIAVTFDRPGKSYISFERPGNSAVTLNRSVKTAITSDEPSRKSISYDQPNKSNITKDITIRNENTYDIPAKNVISNDKCGKTVISYDTYIKNIANDRCSKIVIKKDGIQAANTNICSLQVNKDIPMDTSMLNQKYQIINQNKRKKRQIRLKRNSQDKQITNYASPKTQDDKKPFKWRRRKLTESMNTNCDNSFQISHTTYVEPTSPVPNNSAITVVKTSGEKSNSNVRKNYFAKRDIVNEPVTPNPQEVAQKECSDSEDSVVKKPNNSLNQTVVEDSSISGSDVISNTRSSILSDKDLVLKLNSAVTYKNEEISDSDLFKVTDPNMEENLRVGIEEWVSRFLQIMEEVLTQVLQNHKELLDANMRAPWTVYEATECIRKCFNKYYLVSNAAGSLSETLFKFSDNKGKIRNLTPEQYLQMLSYGVYLVNSLKKEVENSEDIQASEQLLSSLLNDIKHPINLNNTDKCISDNNNDTLKDEKNYDDSRMLPTKRRGSEEISPIACKRSEVTDSKKTNKEPEVKFIRNVNVDLDFLKALKLQKSPVKQSKVVPNSSLVEKNTVLDNVIEATSPKKTVENSLQPKIIRTFNKCPEFEKGLLNKDIIHLNGSKGKNYEDLGYEDLDYDEEIERKDEIEEMDYDDDVDYKENGFKENHFYDNENKVDVTSKKTNDDVGVLVKRFLVIIKETFAEVKVFCDQTSSELCYTESMRLHRKTELQKLIELNQTVINDLLKMLRSILDRETKAPTKIYIKSSLVNSNLLNCAANDESSSYGDIVGKCVSQADVLLDVLSCISQIVNQKCIVD